MDEPRVDPRALDDRRHADTAAQGGFQLEDALRRGHADPVQQVVIAHRVERRLGGIGIQAGPTLLQRAERLLQGLAEGPADGHDLAHRLHAGTEASIGARQLLKGPAGHLGHHVVDGGLERRRCGLGDVVGDLVQVVADGQARGDLGDRKAGGLGGQRGRARDPRIHLDDDPAPRGGIDGELHVGATRFDAHPAQAREGVVTHRLVLDIGQRLGRRHRDGVPGVDTHGVEVLDRAHHDAVVGRVAHDFELVLLPAGNGAFHQNLPDRAGGQALPGQLRETFHGVGDAGARTTENEARPHHDGEADGQGDPLGLVEGVGESRFGHLETDVLHRRLEAIAVLGGGDGLGARPDDLDPVAFEHAPFDQLHGQVQCGLATEGGQQARRVAPSR